MHASSVGCRWSLSYETNVAGRNFPFIAAQKSEHDPEGDSDGSPQFGSEREMKTPIGNAMQKGYPASVRNVLRRRDKPGTMTPSNTSVHLRLASYNVHKCVGTDRKFDPERIGRVIRELSADILALQEVDQRFGDKSGLLDLVRLQADTGLVPIPMPGTRNSHGWRGNLILVRGGTVENVEQIALPGLEPRGAILADLDFGQGFFLRVIAAHLGLLRSSRHRQAEVLAGHLLSKDDRISILMGDLNEWRIDAGSPLAQFLPDEALTAATPRSFPSKLPLLPLDRIIASRPDTLSPILVHNSSLA
ncbi:MAG: endonuclease/exonuclease/phosphatase family protein, partial [bacterium]